MAPVSGVGRSPTGPGPDAETPTPAEPRKAGDPVSETREIWLTVDESGVKWSAVEEECVEGVGRMFFGTYTPKLDDKGRLFLPAKFRDDLAEGLVVTRGQERCLTVWSQADFQAMTERLREAPVTNKGTRDYVRMLFAAASQEVPDKQGRITIPSVLREYASLSKDVMVIGAMNRIEIWDPASWQHVLRGAGAEVLGAQRRGLPGDLAPGTQQHPAPPELNSRIRRTRSRARSLRHLGHLPRFQRTTSPTWGAGRDLVRRIRHRRTSISRGRDHEHQPSPVRHPRHDACATRRARSSR